MALLPVFREMERDREGVAIHLNDVWYSAVVDFGCVSFRILWINSGFQGLKYVWWWGYGPNKGDGEERDRFWNDMDKNLDIVENGYRLCILGDLKGWIGDGKEPA